MKVPYEWLTHSARIYPVVIDPSISIKTTGDTFVNNYYPDYPYGRENYLEIKSYYFSDSRVLIGFPPTSSLPAGMMISSATLWMYSYEADTERTIDVWSVDDLWFEYSVTWNNQPPHVKKLSSGTSGTGWRTWSVTNETLSKWGKYLYLKLMDSEEGGWYNYQHYRSWEYNNSTKLGYVPFLEVTYIPQNDCDVGGDASDTFSGANSISTPKTCSGYLDTSDRDDYYSFSVTSGSKIDVTMIPPYGADFDIYLYNPSGNEKAKSAQDKGYTEIISYTADSSGEWRIKVRQYGSGAGTYSLSVITPIKQNDCGFGSDASNTFSGANPIPNQTSCSGYLDSSDRDDYYKFFVSSGYTINASLIPPSGANFNLYLYDPNSVLKSYSIRAGDASESISYVADSSGEWRIEIYQIEGSGTYSLSAALADKTPPQAPVISSSTHPDKSKWYNNKNPSFTWIASDASGIAGYSYDFDQSSSTTPGSALKSVNSESYSIQVDGIWYFHIRAKDNAGNWGAVAHYTVRVDTTPPSIHISTPANNSIFNSSDILVSWSGSDSNSGIERYEIRLDNGGWTSIYLETHNPFNGLGDGAHKVDVRATDKATNQAETSVSFTIQSLPDLFISSEDITFEKVG